MTDTQSFVPKTSHRHFDLIQKEFADIVQLLKEAKGDPQLRRKLLRKMRELLDEADRIVQSE